MKRFRKYKNNKQSTTMNANISEMSDFGQKVMFGVQLSCERLVRKRSIEGALMCFGDDKGRVYKMPAKEVEKMLIR